MSIEITHLDRNGNSIPRIPPEASDQTPSVGLKQILFILRRHLRLIVAIVLLGTGLAGLLAYTLPTTYQATAQIVLVRNDTRPYDPLGREERDRSAVETEIDVIGSRALAGRVVDSLRLVGDRRFNPFLPSLPPTSLLPQLLADLRAAGDAAVRATFEMLSLPPPARPPIPSQAVQRDTVIANVMAVLKAKRTGESLALDIAATSNDPEFTRTLANTVAAEYVRFSLELKQDPSIDVANLAQAQAAQNVLTSLRADEARLEREFAILASRYGRNHPRMLDAESALASARRLVRSELDRINIEVVTASNKPGARVISLATLPTKPYSPAPSLIIAGGLMGSLMAAMILAMLLESGDTKIRTGRRLSDLAGTRDLGELPKIPKRFGVLRHEPRRYVLTRPRSGFANAVGLVYARCFLVRAQRAPHIVAVTSSLPGEGTSSLAATLAAAAVADGRRTGLIDLNGTYAGTRLGGSCAGSGPLVTSPLGERLCTVDVSSDGAVVESFETAAPDLMSSISAPSLTSGQWREFVAELRQKFDVVIVDAPPVLVVNDFTQVASLVDAVILVACWERTQEGTVAEAVASLRAVNAPLFGTVLNRVEARANVGHGHGGVRLPRSVSRRYLKD